MGSMLEVSSRQLGMNPGTADVVEYTDFKMPQATTLEAALEEVGIHHSNVHMGLRRRFEIEPVAGEVGQLVTMGVKKHIEISAPDGSPELRSWFEGFVARPTGLRSLLALSWTMSPQSVSDKVWIYAVGSAPKPFAYCAGELFVPYLYSSKNGEWCLGLNVAASALRPGAFILGECLLDGR